MDFDGFSWTSATDQSITKLITNFDLNTNKVTRFCYWKGSGRRSRRLCRYRLSKPLDEDITIDYFVISSDVFGVYPGISGDDVHFHGGSAGSVTIPAGETRADIGFYAYLDDLDESVEAFT